MKNPVRPFLWLAAFRSEEKLLNCPCKRERPPNREDTWHSLSFRHPFVGVATHRFHVVGQQDAACFGGPGKNHWIGSSQETDILYTHDVHGRLASEEATEDVVIEVFVGQQTKHGRYQPREARRASILSRIPRWSNLASSSLRASSACLSCSSR